MRLSLTISPTAIQRTKEQADYYRVESGAALAKRWRSAVDETIRSLRKLPERGAPCRFRRRALHDLRRLPVEGFTKHLVFYRFDQELQTVFVVSILHGARDLEKELFKTSKAEPPRS